MSDILVFAFAAVVGFGAAALLAGLYRSLTCEPVSFTSEGPGAVSRVIAFGFRAIVGPAIIVRQSVASVQAGTLPSSWAAASVMLAVVWSGVLGVAILAVLSRFAA